jgi:hypothetical protein
MKRVESDYKAARLLPVSTATVTVLTAGLPGRHGDATSATSALEL